LFILLVFLNGCLIFAADRIPKQENKRAFNVSQI
jgi:hypothetical protein